MKGQSDATRIDQKRSSGARAASRGKEASGILPEPLFRTWHSTHPLGVVGNSRKSGVRAVSGRGLPRQGAVRTEDPFQGTVPVSGHECDTGQAPRHSATEIGFSEGPAPQTKEQK